MNYHTDPDVTAALARIEANVDILVKRDDDKEGRLRSLEKWRYGLAGAITVLGGVVGWPWLK